MVSCIVPGCTNRKVLWTARVPEDGQLRDFWRAAIFGGTGRKLTDTTLAGARVCQMHFASSQQPECGDMYREPTLFFVNESWREVSCCQLCLQYKPTRAMFNRRHNLGPNFSLQSIVFKYFRVRQFNAIQESYFCTNCVILIDLTHRFGETIAENGRAYERMQRKVCRTSVPFEACEKANRTEENEKSDCEIEEDEVETIEVDDDDDEEREVRIKEESEELAVRVKQEDCESELDKARIQVKMEVSDEDSLQSGKEQRLTFNFACLLCKEFFKYQEDLDRHNQRHIQESKKREAKKLKCLLNPKILNKQLQSSVNGYAHFCVPCQRPFKTSMLLKHHQKQRNCKKPKIVCPHCPESFLFEDSLVAHIELAHVPPEKIERCKFCGQVFKSKLFELHQSLICGENVPEPDEFHLKRCVLLFYRQNHQATEAHSLLQENFGKNSEIKLETINAWFSQFDQDDFAIGDPVQSSIKQLIDDNATISVQELSEQVGVNHDIVRLQANLLGLMQKYGRWVPQKLHPSLKKNRFNLCRALVARFKDNTNLNNLIHYSERWIYYGKPTQDTKEPAPNKTLLCIWWDQHGLIFHELLEPEQAASVDRYQAQFSRFTKTMAQTRQPIRHQMIFQYSITDPTARQELKTILNGIGWELLRQPAHSPDIDPNDYLLFQTVLQQNGGNFRELHFSNPGQVYQWVAVTCKQKTPVFFLQGIRMLLKRWEKVVENKGDFCGQ